MSLNRKRKRLLLQAFAVFILLGAIFPNVTHIDHWGDSAPAHVHGAAEELDHHASHCHGDSSQCSNGLSMVGTFWVGDESRLVSMDAPDRLLEGAPMHLRIDPPAYRLIDPPRVV